jgi:hypothetical protein
MLLATGIDVLKTKIFLDTSIRAETNMDRRGYYNLANLRRQVENMFMYPHNFLDFSKTSKYNFY